MVEIFCVEEGNGVAAMEQVGWFSPSFAADCSIDSFLVVISTAALGSDLASMTALDDADAAAAATAGDGVGRPAFAATAIPPPLLPSDDMLFAKDDDTVASVGDASLVVGETSFIVALELCCCLLFARYLERGGQKVEGKKQRDKMLY